MFGMARARRTREQYERDVRLLYGKNALSLTMAQATTVLRRDCRLVDRETGQVERRYVGPVSLTGVISEYSRVRCRLEFNYFDDDGSSIGKCHLELVIDEKLPVEHRKMVLRVHINDQGGEPGQRAYNVMRDAAISRRPFIRFRLIVEKTDAVQAVHDLSEHGSGPTVKVHGIYMWPEITLPDAPKWAWLDEGDEPY